MISGDTFDNSYYGVYGQIENMISTGNRFQLLWSLRHQRNHPRRKYPAMHLTSTASAIFIIRVPWVFN